MAEPAATVPAAATEQIAKVAAVKAAGRGRGKGKAKGRGKFKAKGKKKAAPVEQIDPETGLPVPKPKKEVKKPLKTQVEEEVGDRDIQEVIKEARLKVEELQAAVEKAQADEIAFETNIIQGKTKMEEASASVDSSVHKETIALEKFKAAMQALTEAKKKTVEKRLALGDEEKAMDVLANEGEKSKKEAELLKAKEEAHAAKEAAKKAYMEAQLKEKQVAEEIKTKKAALAITDDPEAEAKQRRKLRRTLQKLSK